MKIFYMGTGASEGIPAVFCRCRVCEDARVRGGKYIRTRAGFVIDDNLMIDFSPDILLNAVRFNIELTKIKNLLITHTHCDHYNYQDLFQRSIYNSMNRIENVLTVYGNTNVAKMFNDMGHEDEVYGNLLFKNVQTMREYKLDDYTVVPLRSKHMITEESLVYIISKGGKTYFHCMDTGDLPEESYEYIQKRNVVFDALTLDLTFGLMKTKFFGHNNLDMFLEMIKVLRELGAVNDNTKIVASHIAHCHGATFDELKTELDKHGIILSYDGMTLEI